SMALTMRVGIAGGRQCPNLPSDQEQIMNLLNQIPDAKGGTLMPEGPAVFEVPRLGLCNSFLHQRITEFQRKCGISPDGFIDPGGFTWNRLNIAAGIAPSGGSANGGNPSPSPTPAPDVPINVPGPSIMRGVAWRYLLNFTRKHEGAVLYMYNNR